MVELDLEDRAPVPGCHVLALGKTLFSYNTLSG